MLAERSFITHSASALIAYTSLSSLICVIFSDCLPLICVVAQSCKRTITKKWLPRRANCIHNSNKVIFGNCLEKTTLTNHSSLFDSTNHCKKRPWRLCDSLLGASLCCYSTSKTILHLLQACFALYSWWSLKDLYLYWLYNMASQFASSHGQIVFCSVIQ